MTILLLACTSEPVAAPPQAPASPLDSGWIAGIVRDPASFDTRVGTGRDGWIALHKNDWPTAAAAGGTAGPRANAELAHFESSLSDISADAWIRLGEAWEKRGTMPAGSAFPLFVAMGVDLGGDGASWRARGDVEPSPLAERRSMHVAWASKPGDVAAARVLAVKPLWTEKAAVGERAFYDPAIYAMLASAYRAGAVADAPSATATVDAALFSASLTGADDARADLLALGIPPTEAAAPTADDSEQCRGAVRTLDAQLDPWKIQLAASATDEGRALLDDLRLIEGARARTLVALGAAALRDDRPRCALAFAEMALDHESPRAIGPINSPTLFAVLAAANLRSGRTREALDALSVLVTPFPEVIGLNETVGDLAVLQGLDRAGDSREN